MSELNLLKIEGHQTLTSKMAFELYELDQKFFPAPWTLDSWNNLFTNHDRFLSVLLDNDQTLGFCLFDRSFADSFAHLVKIVIIPNARNRGLSKMILRDALLSLEVAGCLNIFLEVEESNSHAQKLYLGLGFAIIHYKKDFYGSNRSALIMTKTNKSIS